MAEFTQEARQALRALFTLEEHEIREGGANKAKTKIQWFVYLRREAIQERLDDLFFGEWELYFVDPKQPCIYHKEHVDCSMGLAIRGIRREYNGSQDGGGLNGAKGAATDAIKRVASMWGIGLYMQQAPQIWTENYATYDAQGKKLDTDWKKKERIEKDVMRQIGAWLKSLGASGNSLYAEPSQEEPATDTTPANVTSASFTPANVSQLPQAWTADEVTQFLDYWQQVGYDQKAIRGVLGIKTRWSEWQGTLDQAIAKMREWQTKASGE